MQTTRLSDIQIDLNSRRSVDSDKVRELAESIQKVGLLNPISITPDRRLVAGLHRLEAVKLLGWEEIPVTIVDLEGLRAELAQIDENLIRNEGDVLERAEWLARRKEIYEQLYPETRHGFGPGRGHREKRGNNFLSFSEDTARKIGKSPRTVRQEVQIATKIIPEVKEAIRGTPLADSKVELLKLARLEIEEQKAVAHVISKREAKTVNEAQRKVIRARAAQKGKTMPDISGLTIVAADFRDAMQQLEDDSVDLIFTDPPYDKDSISLYHDLAEQAQRVLKPGGSLLAYCGHYALPTIVAAMQKHLRFWWIIAIQHSRSYTSLTGKKVYVTWKPLIWFVKEHHGGEEFVFDSIQSAPPDKSTHEWAQALKEAEYYIEQLSPAGGLVADPFAGSGTTLLAALRTGRRAWGSEIDSEIAAGAKSRIIAALNRSIQQTS